MYFQFILTVVIIFSLTSACHHLPKAQYLGQRAYYLQQRMECKGGKVYDIDNVQDIEQCKEACRRFDCDAVNLFQLGEFDFKCEILSYVYSMEPAQGAACYYANDALGFGRKK
uniref:Apple domain-containing protein n=1 Tax=Heterorhabditis bacteriophora TaxID=37862 RepID=A0A1I7XSL3_HETBA